MKGIIFLSLFILNIQTALPAIGKLTFVRGKVTLNGAKASKGDSLDEGAIITTERRSIAKITFGDKSKMTIAPKSHVKVAKYKEGEPGIISLLKGKIRNKVEKEAKQAQNKLYVDTPTAAMGVRGTEFQTTYNPVSRKTAVVGFSGEVAFTQKTAPGAAINMNQALNSGSSVSIRAGQFSGTDPKLGRVTLPVKISPLQYSKMKQNDTFESAEKKAEKKDTRSHLPPGFSQALFTNDNAEFKEEIAQEIATGEPTDEGPEGNEPVVADAAPPEGTFNAETKEFAPPAGGYISPNGDYIAPVPGQSFFDPNAGVYVPSTDYGSVDLATGEYIPPAGFELNDEGQFVKEEDVAQGGNDQGPDSGDANNPEGGEKPDGEGGNIAEGDGPPPPGEGGAENDEGPPVGGPVVMEAGEIGSFDTAFGAPEFDPGGEFGDIAAGPGGPGNLDELIDQATEDREDEIEDSVEDDIGNTTTRVNFNITIN